MPLQIKLLFCLDFDASNFLPLFGLFVQNGVSPKPISRLKVSRSQSPAHLVAQNLMIYFRTFQRPSTGGRLFEGMWLGATDNAREGHFVWETSRTPMTYNNWHRGAPDNLRGIENCVQMLKSTGTWNDLPCNITDSRLHQDTMCEILLDC